MAALLGAEASGGAPPPPGAAAAATTAVVSAASFRPRWRTVPEQESRRAREQESKRVESKGTETRTADESSTV